MSLHPLLNRQLNECIGDPVAVSSFCEKNAALVSRISEAYSGFDEEKSRMEQSMEIREREYSDKLEEIKNLQASLISSEKMAGVGQLSAGIAHEINNPLGFIKSNMDILVKYTDRIREFHEYGLNAILAAKDATHEEGKRISIDLLQHSRKDNLEAIYEDLPNIVNETQEGIQRISRIVRSLLNFSRKGTDSLAIGFDLNKGLKDTLTITHNEIKYFAQIEEEFDDLPLVTVNPDEINQVLLNIIMNAVSAIREKGDPGLIKLHTYVDGSYACCAISDNGGGIPDEHLPHIFEPFFTTKPVGAGTGLGLSISYDIIVRKHAGKIDVKTRPGEGTTFIISLPYEAGSSSGEREQAAPQGGQA